MSFHFVFENRRFIRIVFASLVLTACGGATAPTEQAPIAQPQGRDVLAVVAGGELRYFTIDGAATSVTAGDALAGISGVDLIGGGRFLLVRGYAESTPSSGLRLALVTSDGALKWQRSFAVSFAGGSGDNALAWGPSVGEDGSVVLDDRSTNDFHIEAAGAPGSLSGFFPIGRAIDGFLPVRSAWDSAHPYSVTYGWWKIGGALVNTTRFDAPTGFDAQEPVAFGGKMLRLAQDGGVVLRVESAVSTDTIALPQATADARIGVVQSEMFASDERWLLVASGTAGRVIRVDLQSKTAAAIDLAAPSGYRPFSSCRDGAPIDGDLRVDRDGRIVRAFRTDDRVAAFATADGVHWTQIGGSFSDVGGFDVALERGTYTLHAHVGVYCFTPGPTWTPSSTADFHGDWTEIVRPTAGAHTASPSASSLGYALSPSGRYGARWDVDAGTHTASLHLADLETGSDTIIAVDTTVRSAQPVWLWRP